MIPRLHQSIAKLLVSECPAVGKAAYDAEQRKATRAMERGSLVDQLVFGGAQFHVIDSRYKSGPRKGQPVEDMAGGDAKEQAAKARAEGFIPVLPHELEAARELAGLIRSRLLEEGIELDACEKQKYVEWTTAKGCPAAGTPDLGYLHDTIDLKVGHTANPDRLEQHLYDQGWHIQGAAYQESRGSRGRHWLVCAETKSGASCVTVCPLSSAYLAIGLRAWERAQEIWIRGWERNEWPEYQSRPLMPSNSVLFHEGVSTL